MSLSSAVTRQRSDASATAFGIDQVGCYQPVVEQILGASAIGLGDNPFESHASVGSCARLGQVISAWYSIRGRRGLPLYPPQKTMMALCNADTSAYPKAAAAVLSPLYCRASAETLWP